MWYTWCKRLANTFIDTDDLDFADHCMAIIGDLLDNGILFVNP